MPMDSAQILLSTIVLDSANDGTGTGSDPLTAPGCITSVEDEAELAAVMFLKASDTGGEPGDADTLVAGVEVSVDGGTNWNTVADFRSVLGSEVPDDTAAGDKTLRLAIPFRTPRADSGQSNLVKLRPNTVASDTSNWGCFIAIVDRASVRSEWMAQAQQN